MFEAGSRFWAAYKDVVPTSEERRIADLEQALAFADVVIADLRARYQVRGYIFDPRRPNTWPTPDDGDVHGDVMIHVGEHEWLPEHITVLAKRQTVEVWLPIPQPSGEVLDEVARLRRGGS